jgi:hypothetical protein
MPGLRLVAELGGDGAGFQNMMARANMTAKQFGSQAIAPLKNLIAGAFTVGAISALSRKTIEFASHLRDVSDALRVNVEWFQKRANAAKLAGGTEDDLAKFIDTMSKSRSAAVQKPGGVEAKTFERLGFTGAEIQGLNTMEFFDKLVAAFGAGATAQTAVDVEAVGGRTARHLLAAFGNQFQSDAAVMSEQMIDALDDIGDEFTILGNLLLIEFAPAIIAAANAVRKALSILPQFGGGISAGHEAAKAGAAEDLKRGLPLASRMANVFENFWKGFQHGVVSEEADQKDAEDQMQRSKAKARELRKRRELSPPGFEPLDLEREKTVKRAALPTDALVGIGNFLGRNPALVNNIAGQQLQVARQHLEVGKQILAAIRGSKGGAPGTENIQVPAG